MKARLSLAALAALITVAACRPAASTPVAEPLAGVAGPTAAPSATLPPPTATPCTAVAVEADRYTVRVVDRFPHDTGAFTQGLLVEDGALFEGTGLEGRSSLRRVDLTTGQVQQLHELAPELFGEGLTLVGDRLYQLTWRNQVAFVYDRETFELLGQFTYPTEGWGLTDDGRHLIMSDGTATLYFRDPDTFEEVRRVTVTDDNGPVFRLNELEYIDGVVWANIWQTDWIVRIDPITGRVLSTADLAGLLPPEDRAAPVDVLNGIAYDARACRLFVTGKLWPTLFEIELVPVAN